MSDEKKKELTNFRFDGSIIVEKPFYRDFSTISSFFMAVKERKSLKREYDRGKSNKN